MAKSKTRKNNVSKAKKGTLDQKHTEKIMQFEKMKGSLPTKKKKLVRLENELEELMHTNPNKYTHDDIHRKAHLMDTIERFKNEIRSIENCKESLSYIVNNLPILVDYYDNYDIIDDDNENELASGSNQNGKKNILTYFMKERSEPKNLKKNNSGNKKKKR